MAINKQRAWYYYRFAVFPPSVLMSLFVIIAWCQNTVISLHYRGWSSVLQTRAFWANDSQKHAVNRIYHWHVLPSIRVSKRDTLLFEWLSFTLHCNMFAALSDVGPDTANVATGVWLRPLKDGERPMSNVRARASREIGIYMTSAMPASCFLHGKMHWRGTRSVVR